MGQFCVWTASQWRRKVLLPTRIMTFLPLWNCVAVISFIRPFIEKIKLFWLDFRCIYDLNGVIKPQQKIKPVLIIPGHSLVQDSADEITVRAAVPTALCDGKWLFI